MTQETLLSVQNLSYGYDGKKAIHDVNFEIHRGEVVALLGTNGAGKSTTLNAISGNIKPDTGTVKICDQDISIRPKQAKFNLGYLPDIPPLYRELTVQEYIQFAARIHGITASQVKQTVDHSIAVCSLTAVRNKLIADLSKGFKQRVGIAQAIIHKPALVILDEPTIGLDPVQMQDIRALLSELSSNHSVLLSTHMLAEAESTCDRVMIIDQGTLLLDQSLQELNKSSGKRIKLRFNANPSIEELNAIAGCESVSCSQYGNYICRYNDADFIQQVQSLALQNNWQLYEISPIASSLENVFLDLVVRDATMQ